jgi:hypothetical protein
MGGRTPLRQLHVTGFSPLLDIKLKSDSADRKMINDENMYTDPNSHVSLVNNTKNSDEVKNKPSKCTISPSSSINNEYEESLRSVELMHWSCKLILLIIKHRSAAATVSKTLE